MPSNSEELTLLKEISRKLSVLISVTLVHNLETLSQTDRIASLQRYMLNDEEIEDILDTFPTLKKSKS